ncbi:hypothetical protein GCM10010151_59800 [Actinoallomurus spadix]|uniref:DUF3515 domain-containing protein n=1 Tax=Actinoallomurus spadix TaxID=79912 RepID=A0ABN0XE22_9ACTN
MSALSPVCTTGRPPAARGGAPGRLRRAAPVVAVVAVLSVIAAGCGASDVEVPVPRPPASAVSLCRAFHDRLPQRLHGLKRRSTSPRSALVTAWGSPAVVVRCGVVRPAGLHPTSELAVINGINWLAVPPDHPVTFTAVGRHAYVEVTVPPKYTPPGDVLNELTAAIKSTIPANSDATL